MNWAEAKVKRFKASKHSESQRLNRIDWIADGHLSVPEVYEAQNEMGYDPKGYGVYGVCYANDAVTLKKQTHWHSQASCD